MPASTTSGCPRGYPPSLPHTCRPRPPAASRCFCASITTRAIPASTQPVRKSIAILPICSHSRSGRQEIPTFSLGIEGSAVTVAEPLVDSALSEHRSNPVARAIDRWIYAFMAGWFIVIVLVGFIPDALTTASAIKAGQSPPLHHHALSRRPYGGVAAGVAQPDALDGNGQGAAPSAAWADRLRARPCNGGDDAHCRTGVLPRGVAFCAGGATRCSRGSAQFSEPLQRTIPRPIARNS